MAKCYTLESPNHSINLTPKPKIKVINNILNFSKAYKVIKKNEKNFGIVLN